MTKTQYELERLARRVDEAGRVEREARESLRLQLQKEIDERVSVAQTEARGVRVLGVVLLIVGLGLSTAGNLIH